MTSYYFGGAYEVTGTDVKKYYSFGGQTMMRDANGLQYFLSDHLGSVVAVTSDTGTLITQQRYLPFGAERTNIGVITQTDLSYTGQQDLGMGLMDYHARFYSPYLNRFIQPDSLIPDPVNPQAWNRYSYVGNRPVNFNDPTGHYACGDGEEKECGSGNKQDLYKPAKIIAPTKKGGTFGSNGGKSSGNNGSNGGGLHSPPPVIGPPCAFCGDATLISFSYSSGQDTSYVTYGIDIVVTNDEIGIFSVNGRGSGLGEQERDPRLPVQEMNQTYMFPQVNATLYVGQIWGEPLQVSVLNYQGPAKAKGASFGPLLSMERFESVDANTGLPNGDIIGFALGGGVSLYPFENHNVFTDATPMIPPFRH